MRIMGALGWHGTFRSPFLGFREGLGKWGLNIPQSYHVFPLGFVMTCGKGFKHILHIETTDETVSG